MNTFRDIIPYKGSCSFVGSRSVTGQKSEHLIKLSVILALSGYVQYSGAANGTDTSSEFGAKLAHDLLCKKLNLNKTGYADVMKIFLPWNGFSGRFIEPKNGYIGDNPANEQFAAQIAQNHYVPWPHSPDPVKKLMTRNVYQVLDNDLTSHVKFVIAYTSDGVTDGLKTTTKTGGTGQAIRVATTYGVPVFNLGNEKDEKRLLSWVESESKIIKEKYGIDIDQEVKLAIENYSPFKTTLKEKDLVDIIKSGDAEVVIHGCNCFNVKGSGLAKSIFDNFPEAYEADNATKKGDKKKLGTYTMAQTIQNGKPVTIINAYTQYKYGRDGELYADYEAIRKVFKQIQKDFPGKELTIPKIGSGLANGCWVSIANTIKNEVRGPVTLIANGPSMNHEKKIVYTQSELDL